MPAYQLPLEHSCSSQHYPAHCPLADIEFHIKEQVHILLTLF